MKRISFLILALFPLFLYAQEDSLQVVRNDSILREITTLKEIEIKIPRPIYSMDAGVVSYNVANDETIKGGTALDALRNAPSVDVDVEGNVRLRGSSKVQIWINGYPTHMNGESIQVYLTALSAEVIDHIEVIKNPSAEYMVAEGTAIINIVMSVKVRRNKFLAIGLSGNDRPYVSPWASYVFEGDKLDFNVYFAPSISHHNSQTDGASWSFSDNPSGGMDTTQSQRWSTTDSSNDYYSILSMGLSYQIDSMNDLSFNSFTLFQGFMSQSADDRYRTEYMPSYMPLHYITDKAEERINANGFSTLSFRHKFNKAGHNLTLEMNTNWQYYTTSATTHRLFDAYYSDEHREEASSRKQADPNISLRYRRPIGEKDNLSVSIGYSQNNNRTLSANHFLDAMTQAYTMDDTLRDRETLTHDRKEYATLNWRHQTETFSSTLGIIAESHQIDYSVYSLFPEEMELDYVALRPTFNLTCHTKSMHYFSFNYSLSSTHPTPAQLSQSPAYQYDSYTIGNGQLKPYFSHKADMGWNRYFKKGSSVSVEAYGEWNDNSIESVRDATTVPDPYLCRIVPFTTYYNIGSSRKYGLEGNATYRVNAFLRFSLYANLYYSSYRIEHPKTGLYGDSALTYDLRLNCSAKLFKKVNVNLSGDYSSPTISPFIEKRTNYTIDVSASSEFLDNRLLVRVSISDIFNWQKSESANTNPYFITTATTHRDSRYITFGITWRIGKMNLQYRAQSGAGMQ